MLARRFACPPVNEACFELRAIPNARKDMEGTVILKPPREYWLTLLGEMVQMVNEAVRRRASSVRDASKPLSLEYMADRLDVDDPFTGYLAFTKGEGWLQGFITATTFTTWNHGFRWDSTNPMLDLKSMHDEDEDSAAAKARPPLLTDEDGSLSAELQAELHAGDPDDEGVVFPRIAEISLLGALGCGKWLLDLILEGLESADSPYAFVVTQATDGSISFYERMGFIRVGAVTARKRADAAPMDEASGGSGGAASAGKKRKASLQPPKQKWEASPHVAYRTEASDETIEGIAAQHGVSVHDLIFLNKGRYPKLAPDSVLKKDTKLHIPQLPTVEQAKHENEASHARFWEVPETMPFKRVAETLNIEPRDLLRYNQGRMKGLQISSEVVTGTLVQINQPDYVFDEYCVRFMPACPTDCTCSAPACNTVALLSCWPSLIRLPIACTQRDRSCPHRSCPLASDHGPRRCKSPWSPMPHMLRSSRPMLLGGWGGGGRRGRAALDLPRRRPGPCGAVVHDGASAEAFSGADGGPCTGVSARALQRAYGRRAAAGGAEWQACRVHPGACRREGGGGAA